MAIKHLSDEEIRTWTLEQKDRWWLDNVWKGDMPQLTVRSALTGMIIGGLLSLTNLSLLPLELMACGCAVVSNRGPNVQWLLHDDVSVLADATPEALTDAVCELLHDDARRAALSARAESLARAQTWDGVARQFEVGLLAARDQQMQGGAPCAV